MDRGTGRGEEEDGIEAQVEGRKRIRGTWWRRIG